MDCWVIAAACCVINFLILGIARLSPLLFVASMERYDVNRARAAFPYVLCYILRTISGPLIGIGGRKYGLRKVTLFGSFLCFIGIAACYFAEDITCVTILWGGIYGFGFGFGSSLLPIILDQVFEDKHKTKANGISLAGASLGGIVMPPITQASIAEYGLSGSFLILAGFMLHCLPASLLLSVPNTKKSILGNKDTQQISVLHCDKEDCKEINTKCFYTEALPLNNINLEIRNSNQTEPIKMSHKTSNLNTTNSLSGHENLAFTTNDENHKERCLKTLKENDNAMKYNTNEYSGAYDRNSDERLLNLTFPGVPKYVEPSGTLKLLQVPDTNENNKVNKAFSETKKNIQDEAKTTSKDEDNVCESSLRSLRIFVDPTFLLIMFIQSAFAFHVLVVWTIIVDVMRDKGIDKSSEIYCMMFLPAADFIGRLGLGWITDGGYLSTTKFCAISLLLLGVSTIIFVWVHNLVTVLLASFLFGFVSGGLMPVFPSVVCEHMNTQNKIMAMSSRMLLLGPLSLATSPLIAFFREGRGSYDGIFYVLFCISIFCSGLTALIPVFSQRSESRIESEKR